MASRYPNEVRRITRKCLICGRPFRRFKSKIVRDGDGSFCTRECFRVSRHLFRIALETGRFEEILQGLAAILREEEKAA
jgi:hypothetical protein